MTPALTEASTEGHGIHLSPLSSRTMSSETAVCMESSRAGEQSSCPKLCSPKPENGLCSDIRSLKHFGTSVAQTSTQYQTVLLLSSNSVLNLQSKNSQQKKSEERDTCKLRHTFHSSHHFAGSSSESETQVKRELFPGCARQLLTGAHGVCDMTEIECSSADKIQVKCKWHKRNGCLDKSVAVPTEPKSADLSHSSKMVLQGYADVPKSSSTYGKEEEMNTRLHRCLSKQQILLSQAKRAQKRLHSLIAKQVVEHCSHQVRCFVKHQLQRMKIFHKPDRSFDSNTHKSTEIEPEASIPNCETNPCREGKNGLSIPAPHEVHSFALSAAGLLSHAEAALDSDATGSSSDEDLDEKGMQKTEAGDFSSEWVWLVDRARVGSRWTWLQAQISELEYKIQQLTDIHNQIRATKGMVILEEFALPKERGKQQLQLRNSTVLKSSGVFPAPLQGQDSSLAQDLEMSPSSPTLLLQNIEKQSAQLSEIVNSLITPLSLSPASSPRSSKSFSHKRLANGICLSALKNRVENSSAWHLSSEQQHSKKRRKDRTRMKSPAVSSACTSARTRPLQSIHKRKLYRLNSACCLNQLPLSSEAILLHCGRQLPFAVPTSTCSNCEKSKTRALGQHILEVDSSFHPVLSLPSDVSLHVYLETLLSNLDEIKSCSVENTPVKKECTMTSTNEAQCSMSCSQWHSGYSPNSQRHLGSELLKERKRRHKSETAAEESDTKYETSFTCQNISGSQNNSSAVPDSPVVSRSSQKPSAQGTLRRRLRSESSYDIDNIVIPMSLVAPSKVEKLQYKEILTPSWRVVGLQPLRLHVEEEEVEDLSDEAFSSRHESYEQKEKARWSLWEQSRWHRRNSRSSRNTDEWQGHASVFRGNSSDCWPLVHSASEGASDVMSSETYCFDSTWPPNSPEEKQERKGALDPKIYSTC
ncbi:KAT8 regulatory NSL complex subunit 1-like protein isoform X2 [Microcaecilia unicolor]|uniref:KAT8 regulatory NSL complex subunit 1-like protein isoform X2 n=1 Tax=Microcaecilia unicolor TaxID=1415580 RepID=A0A6P7YKV8_9AMPH|nr:KAT8 regulatory NSL complex subunit 1-like protein isoform X2 [Microcaecilia unicolor]